MVDNSISPRGSSHLDVLAENDTKEMMQDYDNHSQI